jgi:Zn-dependent M28 family amino/carboxypeptidase
VIPFELSAQCGKLRVINARPDAGLREDEHVKKIARLLCALGMLGALATFAVAQAGRAPQLESITAEELRADLFFLASDRMQGRLTNTPTNELAADWVLSRFERLGLRPGGQSGYEHRYALMTATLEEGNEFRLGDKDSAPAPAQYRVGEHFYPHRFSANAGAAAPLTFAGFGIVSPERNHDDYRDAVRGRIALVLDREPGVNDPASPFDGVVTAEAATPLRKVLAAQDKGALGVILVEDVHNQNGPASNFEAQAANYWPPTPPRIERYTLKSLADRVRIPVMQVSEVVARQLVAATGRSLLDLAKSAETRGGVAPVPIDSAVSMTARVAHHTVADRSIVAVLEGRDPQLKNEYVLVSAHFDHDGADGPRVYNGADDDGSGTVGLIEIAEAYALAAKAGQGPRRSIIFAAWNSEERGLLGAWAYAEDPLVPLDRIVAVLNMDMIGRNEEVPVGGGGRFRGLELQTAESNANATNIIGTVRSPDLRAALEAANKAVGLELKFRYDNNISNLMRRSDHWPFIQKGVPGVWVHTGLHPDYHTIYDRPEKINYPKMVKIARMVYQASWDLANAAARPKLLPIAPSAAPTR